MWKSLIRSILHNVGVVCVGFAVAFIGSLCDRFFDAPSFHSLPLFAIGIVLILAGFLLRVWATFLFYQHNMRVIALHAQDTLLTTGPYAFTRNPLYLGGNVFIFFGAALTLGSYAALIISAVGVVITDRMIRREEKQLAEKFSAQWSAYASRVRRWL